jgi:hypothetical protein
MWRVLSDASCLDLMAEQLSGREWDAEAIERIAELIQLSGRTIDPPEEEDEDPD